MDPEDYNEIGGMWAIFTGTAHILQFWSGNELAACWRSRTTPTQGSAAVIFPMVKALFDRTS